MGAIALRQLEGFITYFTMRNAPSPAVNGLHAEPLAAGLRSGRKLCQVGGRVAHQPLVRMFV
jgi:hypothetical protein